jgi:putative redox protein
LATVTVRSQDGYRSAIHVRNHTIIADEPLAEGGMDSGPTPTEMLLGSLGSCITITTQMFARRKNWPLEGVAVELEMARIRREDYPAYTGEADFIHEIRTHIHFEGPLTDEQRARLMTVSGKCPVHLTLTHPVIFVEKLVERLPEE